MGAARRAVLREETVGVELGRVANAVEIPWRPAPGMRCFGFLGGEVKRHGLDGLRQGFPTIALGHLNLAEGQQGPQQHGHGLYAGQHGLGLAFLVR